MGRVRWAVEAGIVIVGLAIVAAIAVVVSFGPSSSAPGGHAGMIMPPAGAPTSTTPHSDGLTDSDGGFRLKTLAVPKARGQEQPVAFQIIGPGGTPERRFTENATKQIHFFVVRDDMTGYQHRHPVLDGDIWHTTVAITDGGSYRMYAEFVPLGSTDLTHPTVLGAPFVVAGSTAVAPLPPPAATATAGPFTVTRPDGPTQPQVKQINQLRFAITDALGEPAALGAHLGAYAHLSAFNTISMSVTHLHPLQPLGDGGPPRELTFHAQFAERGEHRLFLEFAVAGVVRLAEFTLFVT
ncbi:hypothetical protein EV193_109212 [Herbihabitans rhizosphaerae]|uniref:Secreted protein n=1 Tax=Herbihabitans rhizosphaerae TaxID=1872711 RepID=A0A4Q7KHP1_9PSEU|nr:hypothetical protein [Herbihabitans rhizosphaerae]RZS34421.1 hypothetical protein EV193_109212 [Herbihabitans rhizosphaerae]